MRHVLLAPLTRLTLATALSLLALAPLACGGSSSTNVGTTPATDGASPVPVVTGDDDGGLLDANGPPTPEKDAGAPGDAAPPVNAAPPTFPPDPIDGTPTREACTGNFGSGVSAVHGRLDGLLVAIVQPHSNQACNSDTHVHLQVLMGNAVYDVATNLQTLFYTEDIALPGGAWSDGWHTSMSLDYPAIGIHSSQFTQPASEATLAATVTADLANANHISVFSTGYNTQGVHDVHRRGSGNDGAIFTDPLAAKAHGFFFRFDTDSF